jgi:hypothetical protein
MSALRKFITERRNDLLRLLAEVKAELLELEQAEAALGTPSAYNAFSQFVPESSVPDSAPEDLTIQQMALWSLHIRGNVGGTAQEIIEFIDADFQRVIERTSLSPQLSRLRKAGKLYFVEGKYTLSDLGEEYVRSVFYSEEEEFPDE